MALKRIGANFEHHRVVEFDKFAIASYNAVHGTNFPAMDITKIHAEDLAITETDKYCYMMTYSFPCFTGDTLVLTADGYKAIKDVKTGDMVLTHRNRYREVIASKRTGKRKVIRIRLMCGYELKLTPEHKLWCTRRYVGHDGKFKTKPARWVRAKDLTKKDYIGFAINQNSIIPSWIKSRFSKGIYTSYEFWWLMGRYLWRGAPTFYEGISIVCEKWELSKITEYLDRIAVKYSLEESAGKVHVTVNDICLGDFAEYFTSYTDINIPAFMFDMPRELIKAFCDGYTKNCYSNHYRAYVIHTESRECAYSWGQLLAKAYHNPYGISRINDKKYNWEIKWTKEGIKGKKSFYKDGCLWSQIWWVEDIVKWQDVYDIEVERDKSFTANGAIAHNCTALQNRG